MLFQEYKKLLTDYVSIKSVSTDSSFKDEIQRTVDWLVEQFEDNDFDVEVWHEGESHPVVFAEFEADPDYETVLVYGHYDVQPAAKEDGWEAAPFKLIEKDGRLYARGVVDNKGQNLIHAFTVDKLIRSNNLKYNVKFMIEGNEETGSPDMRTIVKQHQGELACDYVVISDGEIPYKPMLEASLRGNVNFRLIYKTAKKTVHSGLFGGAFPNPVHELSRLINKIYNEKHRITIPGFYDDVVEWSEREFKELEVLNENKKESVEGTGVRELLLEDGHNFASQLATRPMITVSGIKAGYIGEGFSNIVPNSAEARINFRLAPNQEPDDIIGKFKEFVEEDTPDYVDFELEHDYPTPPIKINISSEKHTEVRELLEDVYEGGVIINYNGATIPVVVDFKEILGVDPILVPLGNDDCNMHGVNENFDVELIKKGLEFSKKFFADA